MIFPIVKRSIRYFLLPLVLGGLPCHVYSQNFYFDNYSVQEGLAASKVYRILQDSSGYIWLGTEAGLTRFDGAMFVNYTANDGLSPNGVKAILQDSKGRLWAGHLGGGVSLKEEHSFTPIDVAAYDVANDITAIIEDAQGRIWISSAGSGVLRITDGAEGGTWKVEHITGENGLSDRVFDMAISRSGTLHFITDVGIKTHIPGGDSFEFLNNDKLPKYFQVTTMFEDSKGIQWFGTYNGGLYRYNPSNKKFDDFDILDGLSSNFIMSIAEDRFGNIWVGTWDGGINRFNEKDFMIFDESNGLHGRSVRCIMEDREGNILIGTNENGLDIFKGEQFVTVGKSDGLLDEMVSAIDVDNKGRLWIGADQGISVFDPNAKLGQRVQNLTAEEEAFTNNKILVLAADERGHIWFETPGGFYEHDPGTGRFNKLNINGSFINNVSCLESDKKGNLWIGTPSGLIKYNTKEQSATTITQLDGLVGSNISALHVDVEGTMWVGARMKGISRVSNGVATPLELDRKFTTVDLTTDHEDNLWVGTEGQGVLVVKNRSVVRVFDVANGLLSNSIRSLETDDQGNIWIGTNKGLNKYDPNINRVFSYTERAGFTGIEARRGASCKDNNGDLWFGTARGAVMMNNAFDLINETEPLTNITGLKVNLTERQLGGMLDLSYEERSLIFEYGSICISDPDAVRYQFMMEGLNEEWQPPTTQTNANYNFLPPGNYVFKVRARNNAGIWNDKPTEYAFRIAPPWWMTWWFYTSAAVLAAIIIFSYIKIREKKLKKENRVLEEKVYERTEEVRAQKEEIEGQKEEIEDLLLNILPKVISEELKEKGKATARGYECVSVLFTDFKGFTQIAEKLSPEELVKELDTCFIDFDEIIGEFGLEKIKTIGDAYMCAGGIPISDNKNPIMITLAALKIRDRMLELKEEKIAKGEPYWEARIGIHTGPVVAGVVGKRKFAYDIWGDTVNTASRMESSGSVGEVNVSGATYELIKDYFELERRGKVEAKNKGQIDMYFVKGLRSEYANGVRLSQKLKDVVKSL